MSDLLPPVRKVPSFVQGRFVEPGQAASISSLYNSFFMYLNSLISRRNADKASAASWYAPSPILEVAHFRMTWLGHATYLIQLDGINILTDPVFGDLTLFFKRILAAGISFEALPRIDYVLISHNHRDHMDAKSLISLKKKFPLMTVLVPRGDKQWFERRGFSKVRECMWWEQVELDGFRFTFLPAKHWSQRGMFDRNKSLWGSWMIEQQGKKIYFAGDTAYDDHFKAIHYYFPSIDVACMPIAPCEPRAWMSATHMDAHEAVLGFIDLRARCFFPMHWGTFYFGIDTFFGPLERLQNSWRKLSPHLSKQELFLPKVGQACEIEEHSLFVTQEARLNL